MLIEAKVDELDCRVRVLETSDARTEQRINDLIQSLSNLLWWVKALVLLLITQMCSTIGYLIVHWVEGG